MTDEQPKIKCPNCNSEILKKDILMIMFQKVTVMSCPICKKTISLQPREF